MNGYGNCRGIFWPAPDDGGGAQGHLRLFARYRLRVVRLLHLRDSGRHSGQAVLLRGSPERPRSSSPCSPLPLASRCGRFGALVFGRIGDLVGRKYTFLITITCMGMGTFLIGLLPTYASAGIVAPIILIAPAPAAGPGAGRRIWRRCHLCRRACAAGQRGLYTSWIQTTATLGLFVALLLILDHPHRHGRRSLRRLGLAHSVPAVGDPAGDLALDPHAAHRIARLQSA